MLLYKREVHFAKKDKITVGIDILSTTLFQGDSLVEEVFSRKDPESAKDITARLVSAGYSSRDSKQTIEELVEAELLCKNADIDIDQSDNVVKEDVMGGISLNISHVCNMTCSYCFGDGGSYGGPETKMTLSVTKKAIEYLYSHCGDRKECMIGFFGGEPLTNWPILRESILYSEQIAKTKEIRTIYFITTNATLVTRKMLEFLEKYDTKLVISIDGPEFIHDQERKTKAGKGTYQLVKDKVTLIAEFPKIAVQARPTITPLGSGYVENIYQHIVTDLGIARVHARPQSSFGSQRGLNAKETAEFVLGIDKSIDWMLSEAQDERFVGVINVLKYVNILYHRIVRHYHCGAGTSVLSISPDGSVFPCPRFTGEKEFLLGNIITNVSSDYRLRFFQNGVMSRDECKTCWARHICGGGCCYMHWNKSGSINYNNEEWCNLTRGQIDLAMIVYAKVLDLPDEGDQFFSNFTPNLPSEFNEER